MWDSSSPWIQLRNFTCTLHENIKQKWNQSREHKHTDEEYLLKKLFYEEK